MFQKMSDEELERRTRDAEEVRRSIVLGKKNEDQPEESFHTTTDKEFKQRYGGSLYQEDNNNPSPIGPTNVQIEKTAINNNRQKRRRIGVLQNEQELENTSINQSRPSSKRQGLFTSKQNSIEKDSQKGVVEKSLDIYGSTVGRGLITSAYAWTNFIYFTFQIWLGIIAAIAIGIVFAIEFYVGSGVTQTVFNSIMASIGVDWDFYLVATLCYMMVVVVCYIQLFGVAIQAKSLGLHPLGGRGGYFKTAAFLLCFIMYWIPIINCLPLVNIYILSIQVSPR